MNAGRRAGGALSTVQILALRDGRRLCVRRGGRLADGALVLLHGLLDSSEGWSELCQRLPRPFVAFDLPGFGDSDAPSDGVVEAYARDITEGLEILGVRRCTLVGHSLGGAIATAVAELLPNRVDALVLLAPAGFGRIPLAEAASMPALRTLVGAALPVALSSRVIVTAGYLTMVTNGRLPRSELVDRVTSRGRHLVTGTGDAIRAIGAAGQSPQAFFRRRVGYDGPVIAVWGDCDRVVPLSHQDGVRAALPQARVHVWRGMGHHPVRERLDDLVALIADASGRHAAHPRAVNGWIGRTRPPLADAA